ncbi:WD40 repeat domain-containing protein [Plantactinospora siamensis]|uniref:WD40 repeat domain-containing protein n=1 Tax=Plantactinospora siamensis TaxID=555372 RepID=A0ABV6P5P0_9ACTN
MALMTGRTRSGGRIAAAHQGPVWPLAMTCEPSGRSLIASASHDGMSLWDATTGSRVMHRPSVGSARRLWLDSSDGKDQLLAVAEEDDIRVHVAETGKQVRALTGGGGFWSVASAPGPDGHRLWVAGGHDGRVHRWIQATGESYGDPLTGHTDSVKAVAATPLADGTVAMVSGGDDQMIRRWDAARGVSLGEPLAGHAGSVVAAALIADVGRSPIILAGDTTGALSRWDFGTGEQIGSPIRAHEGGIIDVCVLGTGRGATVITTGYDQVVRRWHGLTGDLLDDGLRGASAATGVVGVNPALVVGGLDGGITLLTFDRTGGSGRVSTEQMESR